MYYKLFFFKKRKKEIRTHIDTCKQQVGAKDGIDSPSYMQLKREEMKQVQPLFWLGSPQGPEKAITLNTKEKEACHIWHDEHKAWPQPAVPQRRPVRKRPGNKQPLNCLTRTDSSSQPRTQDRCQAAVTLMTQSTSWGGRGLNTDESSEVILFTIRVCSRTCYLDVLDVINPFIAASIWWVRHSKVEQKSSKNQQNKSAERTHYLSVPIQRASWRAVWKADDKGSQMSGNPMSYVRMRWSYLMHRLRIALRGEKGPDPLCFRAEVWWKQDVLLITLPYTSLLIDAASCETNTRLQCLSYNRLHTACACMRASIGSGSGEVFSMSYFMLATSFLFNTDREGGGGSRVRSGVGFCLGKKLVPL